MAKRAVARRRRRLAVSRQPRLSCRGCRAVRLGAPYRLPTGAPAAKTRQGLACARRFRLPLVSRRVQILRLLPPLSAKRSWAKRNHRHPDACRRVVLHFPIHRLSGGNPPRPAGQAVHMGKPAAAPELFPHHHIGPHHPRRAVSKQSGRHRPRRASPNPNHRPAQHPAPRAGGVPDIGGHRAKMVVFRLPCRRLGVARV